MIEEQRAPADANCDGNAAYAVLAQEDRQLSLDQSLDVAVVHGVRACGGTSDQRGDQDQRGNPHGMLVSGEPKCLQPPLHQLGRKQNVPGALRRKKAPDFSGAIVQDGEPD
jgi:hypothetical protein